MQFTDLNGKEVIVRDLIAELKFAQQAVVKNAKGSNLPEKHKQQAIDYWCDRLNKLAALKNESFKVGQAVRYFVRSHLYLGLIVKVDGDYIDVIDPDDDDQMILHNAGMAVGERIWKSHAMPAEYYDL